MKEGKISNSLLQKGILDRIVIDDNSIAVKPGIGEDCSALLFGDDLCVVSTDPITGTDKNIGSLAVQISCNDIASSGAKPFAMLITILAPTTATEEELLKVFNEINQTASKLNISIIGGHTEVTSSVQRFVISVTAFGKCHKDSFISTYGAKVGDKIIMTKYAGIEGTTILFEEYKEELKKLFSQQTIKNLEAMSNDISVINEGQIFAKFGVNSMHDATEGGVLGGIWEIATAGEVGCEVFVDKIPVNAETQLVCDTFNISPYKLISSGCMLATIEDESELLEHMGKVGIKCTVIGEITQKSSGLYINQNGMRVPMEQPDSDDLYKIKAI